MNTLYITDSSKAMIDENENVLPCIAEREAIRSIYLLKEETKIVYNKLVSKLDEEPKYETNTIYGDPGQLVIIFYENSFKHPVIIVNSELWADNLRSYNDAVQSRLGKDQINDICNAFTASIESTNCDNKCESDN